MGSRKPGFTQGQHQAVGPGEKRGRQHQIKLRQGIQPLFFQRGEV